MDRVAREAETGSMVLSIAKSDPERRLGLRGGRFTQPTHLTALAAAGLLTVLFFLLLIPLEGQWIYETFTQRGTVPYLIILLSLWSLIILLVKSLKISVQRRALSIRIVPTDATFVLSANTAQRLLDELNLQVDDPKQFVLFNRIQVALSNLKNIGRIADVDDILQSQAEHDEALMESSYTILRGLVWGIPVLGFIGTVIGLSVAIGSFGGVLSVSTEVDELRAGLQQVTGGLAVAFETTLQALIAALVIHLLLTMVRRSEERLLNDCREYCQRNIVGRLRIVQPETS